MGEMITDNVTTKHTDPVSNITIIINGIVRSYKSHNMSQDIFPTVINKSLSWPEVNWVSILSQEHCNAWQPLNQIYFQVGNAILLLSFLAPYSLWGFLFLRSLLVIGCSLYGLWSWRVACYLDCAAWNLLFVLINLIWAIHAAWTLRPLSLPRDVDQVYQKLFQPLKVSKRQFKQLLSKSQQMKVRKVSDREIIIEEKVSRVDSLSLVLKGRFLVSQGGKSLHTVSQHEFLDSPEWFVVTTDEFFQVTVTALEDSSVLVWHRDKLKFQMMEDPFLKAVFDHVLGKDVVNKLIQAQYDCSSVGNGHVLLSPTKANGQVGEDEKPMLAQTTIPSILRGDSTCWRLGMINETEDETGV